MFSVIEEGSMRLDKPPSQETERNLNLGKHAMRRTCGSLDSGAIAGKQSTTRSCQDNLQLPRERERRKK
jgi:hypothetical protein